MAIGCVGQLFVITGAYAFGYSRIDVLLVRDIVFAVPAAVDYTFILAGLWKIVGVERFLAQMPKWLR